MPRFSLQEKTKIIEFWHQVKSVNQVQRFTVVTLVSTCVMSQTFEPSRPLLQKNPGSSSTEKVPRSVLKVTM